MSWTKLTFGPHGGKTLPQILFTDAGWFFDAIRTGEFPRHQPALVPEVNKIAELARRIKIPSSAPPDSIVEYYIHSPTGKFARFEVVPQSQQAHIGSSPAFRLERIDMSVPYGRGGHDKSGYWLFIGGLKELYPGISAGKKRAEAFFDDPANFTI
jgi:hypothetical protein